METKAKANDNLAGRMDRKEADFNKLSQMIVISKEYG